jgi:hypothetical protein
MTYSKTVGISAKGIVHGNRIDIVGDLGLPDGACVWVSVTESNVKENLSHQKLLSLAGVWKDDPIIDQIFEDIVDARLMSVPRLVDFDAAP